MWKRVVVVGRSMEPTLREGQRLVVGTNAYRRKSPRRGELVVVQHPSRELKLVKRVLHVPGDEFAGRRLGPDEFIVRGDNAAATTDGFDFGPIGRLSFLGRILFSYVPLGRVA